MRSERYHKDKGPAKAKQSVKNALLVLIPTCCAIALFFGVLIFTALKPPENTEVYDNLQQLAAPTTEIPTPTNTPTPTIVPVKSKYHTPDRDMDFDLLRERNPDIVAWISLPDAGIDYPVVISSDNTDYLGHDIYGNENQVGSIFMDMGNTTDFSDRNTVIYGHNMKSGSMFGELKQFADPEFFRQDHELKIYTPEGMLVYQIFAAYETDDENILYHNNFSDDQIWKEYMANIFSNRDMSANISQIDVDMDSQIVTLSTCIAGKSENRLLVQGLLIEDEI